MLSCHACTKRIVQSIIRRSATSFRPPRTSLALSRHNSRRAITSSPRTPFPEKTIVVPERKKRRDQWFESRGIRPANNQARKKLTDEEFALRKELQFLNDPLKLAALVRKRLKDGEFDKTLSMIRAASKDLQCTVSWNHLIDWQLSKGKMNAALKTYNEMKKRAQVPDAYTYTILFRGCAEHPDAAQALAKVLSLYQGMLLDKSPVKPTTIHMNALLKMCARAKDMDALFTIANDLPATGIRATNNLTYTTIFNGLRMDAISDIPERQTPMQSRQVRRKAIASGRLLWPTIITRWQKGDIWIDEELVCSMGRLLGMGGPSDTDDILSLIEQTMNIPRQVPRLGSLERSMIDPQSEVQAEGSPELAQFPAVEDIPITNTESKDNALYQQFTAMTIAKEVPINIGSYAKPGRNSLSLVMTALLDLHLKAPATKYWGIFTKQKGVIPDSDNFHVYMRILRLFRASTEVIELLRQMPKNYMAYKTFRIAMSTCQRNKLNRHAFSNAGKVLDLMQMNLEVPDIPTCTTYLEIALESPAYSSTTSINGATSPSKFSQGQQILRALGRLNPCFVNISSLFAYGDPTDKRKDNERTNPEFKENLILLAQSMIRANDTMMDQAMVPREQYSEIMKQRSKLAAFVTRWRHAKDDRTGRPNLFDFNKDYSNTFSQHNQREAAYA